MTTIMEQQSCEEHTFLFGSKKIRCYGSIDYLNSPSTSAAKISRILIHKVQSTDTLQKLELRYNSSMFEIKRLNKLWSSQSLHCKSDVLIPIFDEQAVDEQCSSMQATSTSQQNRQKSNKFDAPKEEESLDQLLKRIDMSMKRTKKAVKRFRQYDPQEGVEGE